MKRWVIRNKGFTIVELLIVIVVIGILAAITIVAFNGVTNRARIATIQSDLENSAKSLEISKTTSSSNAYPMTLADANLKASSGNTFTYYPNSVAFPSAYCLQAANGSTVYSVSTSVSTPTVGGCTITNLAVNPSIETNASSMGGFSSATSSVTQSLETTGGAPGAGSNFYRLTVSGGTNGAGGVYEYNIPVTPGKTYTASAYTRVNNTKSMNVCLEWHSPSAQLSAPCGASQNVGQVWTRLSVTGVAPANATTVTVIDYTTTPTINAGDVFDIDAIMVTEGSSLYGYADGGTYGWTWNGTVNSSSSTGPQY